MYEWTLWWTHKINAAAGSTEMAEFKINALQLILIFVFLLALLVVLYALLSILKRRHLSKKFGVKSNKCAICGHHVTFISSCCHKPLKYLGPTAVCTGCRKICDVVCRGCGHEECFDNCERCIRKIEPESEIQEKKADVSE